MTPKPQLKFYGVTWNIPEGTWRALQKAKAAGQEALDVPHDATLEDFGKFVLSLGIATYEKTLETNKPEPLIMTPDQYVGQRTPKR